MSQENVIRFPRHTHVRGENNPEGASQARQRIAALPDPYVAHAHPDKERLVGAVHPVSAALEATARPQSVPATGPEGVPHVPDEEPPRRLPGKTKPIATAIFTFVLLYLVFKAPIFLNQIKYWVHPQSNAVATDSNATAAVGPESVISIPKINVKAPIVYASSNVESAIQHDLESGVVHYANTAVPGEPGNSVIFGHSSNDWWEPGSYKFVFVLLDKLQPEDTFTVNYNSKQYLYKVTTSKVVEPTDLSVIAPTSDSIMTLITCTPPGTSWKRLVVQAKQISPAPQQASATGPQAGPNDQTTLPGNSSGIGNTLGNWWQSVVNFFRGEPGSKPQEPQGTTLPAAK